MKATAILLANVGSFQDLNNSFTAVEDSTSSDEVREKSLICDLLSLEEREPK